MPGEQGEDAHVLRGEKIVFTGKLDTLSRKQAQNLVSALRKQPSPKIQQSWL